MSKKIYKNKKIVMFVYFTIISQSHKSIFTKVLYNSYSKVYYK